MIQGPNGDIFVVLSNSERSATEKVKNDISGKSDAEVGGKSANRILVYRDANKDGIPESSSVFLQNLNQPYGMLIIKDKFYVAKLWGLSLLLALTFLIGFKKTGWTFDLTVILGFISHVDVILIVLLLPKWRYDVPSFYHAWRIRKGRHVKKTVLFN